jgi:hypothetical protein
MEAEDPKLKALAAVLYPSSTVLRARGGGGGGGAYSDLDSTDSRVVTGQTEMELRELGHERRPQIRIGLTGTGFTGPILI